MYDQEYLPDENLLAKLALVPTPENKALCEYIGQLEHRVHMLEVVVQNMHAARMR